MVRHWQLAGLSSLLLLFGAHAPAALAADTGATGTTKFEIELGDVPHYLTEADGNAACKPDGVVWADRKTGFYYPKFYADYGKTEFGFYTCYKQAVKADYWSLTPASDGGHKGRSFPQFFCGACF